MEGLAGTCTHDCLHPGVELRPPGRGDDPRIPFSSPGPGGQWSAVDNEGQIQAWLTTTACEWPELSVYCPPALQVPAEAHDSERIMPSEPTLPVPGPNVLPVLGGYVSLSTSACRLRELSW